MRVPFTLGDALRLLVLCLIVGFVIKALGFGPVEFWTWVSDAFDWVGRHSAELLGNMGEYVVIGAAVVLPIAALRYAWRWLKAR